MGLNGIDNGKLRFSQVRVPRTAMLNKLNDVTSEGVFKSDIKKNSQRFFKVADRLLSGRLCISAMCISGTKMNLLFAIRYSQLAPLASLTPRLWPTSSSRTPSCPCSPALL